MNPYLADILAQPAALHRAIHEYNPESLVQIRTRLDAGAFDRIVITGMGASLHAAYPAYLHLSNLPVPVLLLSAAELVHFLSGVIGPRTLLWINSQSGRSAEILRLLERVKDEPPANILSCTNDETTPSARAADLCLPVHAGSEATVSTKTYLNTLAVNLLAASQLLGQELATLRHEMSLAADKVEAYLDGWQARAGELDTLIGDFANLYILGRGSSMSAVWNGALINKEAARCSFEGMNAGDFRHGPLELAGPGLCALIYAGPETTAALNRNLAIDIFENGGRVVWLDAKADPDLPTLVIPETPEFTRPLVEILPVQILTLVMAARKGITAGSFRIVGKITAAE